MQNPFENREESSLELFAKSCSEKVKKLSLYEFSHIIEECHAKSIIQKNSADARL